MATVLAGIDPRKILLLPQPRGRAGGNIWESWRAARVADGIEYLVGVNKHGVTEIGRPDGYMVVGKDDDGARRVAFDESGTAVTAAEVMEIMNLLRRFGPPLDRVRSPRRLRQV